MGFARRTARAGNGFGALTGLGIRAPGHVPTRHDRSCICCHKLDAGSGGNASTQAMKCFQASCALASGSGIAFGISDRFQPRRLLTGLMINLRRSSGNVERHLTISSRCSFTSSAAYRSCLFTFGKPCWFSQSEKRGAVCAACVYSGCSHRILAAPPCPLWVISGHSVMSEQCPLYPQKPT